LYHDATGDETQIKKENINIEDEEGSMLDIESGFGVKKFRSHRKVGTGIVM